MALDNSLQPGSFTGTCAHSGESIRPGCAYVAALVDGTGGDGSLTLRRVDTSLVAWEAGHRPAGLIAFWRSEAPSPDDRRTRFVDDETLLDMLERLGEATDPRQVAYRWVLALLLLRKRLLRQDSIRRDDVGHSWWTFRRRGVEGAPSFEVLDPGLRDADVADLADQLSEVIASDVA